MNALKPLAIWCGLVCLGTMGAHSLGADPPTVGDGRYEIYVDSIYLVPSETLAGRMNTLVSYSMDHTYHQEHLDGLPPSDAQSLGSFILSCYNTPCADLMFETTYSNISLNAGATLSALIHYDFVAYNRIGLALPAETLVPLIATGYASASLTDGGPSDYAAADVTIDNGPSMHVRVGAGGSGTNDGDSLVAESFYAHPDWANSVTLQVAGSIVFSGSESLSGTKGLQVIADPEIRVDPTATILVDGTEYSASDVFGLAFSSGFTVVPEPSVLAMLIGAGIVVLVIVLRRRRRRDVAESEIALIV